MVRVAGRLVTVLAFTVLLTSVSVLQEVGALGAVTYLLKGGQIGRLYTDQEVVDQAIPWVAGATGAAPPEPMIVVDYPASFWPFSPGGFSDPTFDQSVAAGVAALPSPMTVAPGTIIAGGSEGAVVVSMYKRKFNDDWATRPQQAPGVVFGAIANPMRPNGGLWERLTPWGTIPIIDLTLQGATPTWTAGAAEGRITTFDIARQYDGIADFPTNPLFVLSDLNAVVGLLTVHSDVATVGMKDAVLQGEYGDTRYYLVPTYPVPLLLPVQMIPVIGPTAADSLDPLVRLLVEAGYDRTISPGQPTPADYRYFPDPVALGRNLLLAVSTGLDNGVQDVIGVRPLGTQRPDVTGQGAYGVNGPPVTMKPTADDPAAVSIATARRHSIGTTRSAGGNMPSRTRTPLSVASVPNKHSAVAAATPTATGVGGSSRGSSGTSHRSSASAAKPQPGSSTGSPTAAR